MVTVVKKLGVDPLQSNTNWLSLWCVLGLCLSIYTLYVELRHAKDHNYKALCDISEHVSCSKAFMSKYGKGMGLVDEKSPLNIPNPVFGILFYTTQLLIALFCGRDQRLIQAFIVLAVVSNIGSVYLGYILFSVLKNYCVVCIAMYFLNFFMLIAGYRRSVQAKRLEHEKKE